MLVWLSCWVSSMNSTSKPLSAESCSRAGAPAWSGGRPAIGHTGTAEQCVWCNVVGVVVEHPVHDHHGVGAQHVHQHLGTGQPQVIQAEDQRGQVRDEPGQPGLVPNELPPAVAVELTGHLPDGPGAVAAPFQKLNMSSGANLPARR